MAKTKGQTSNMYSPIPKKSRKRHTKLTNKHKSQKPTVGQGKG